MAGTLPDGTRYRKNWQTREEAEADKIARELTRKTNGDVRTVASRLRAEQVAEAERCFARLPDGLTLSAAVDLAVRFWRPPAAGKQTPAAVAAFLEAREKEVRRPVFLDYKRVLTAFAEMHDQVDAVTTLHVEAFCGRGDPAPKTWNNRRGILHAFFVWCCKAPRKWSSENPVADVQQRRVMRGVPEVIDSTCAAKLMRFVATWRGPTGKHSEGYLVPYFAITLFAGIRPDWQHGEVRKLSQRPELIDLRHGIIRITPEIAKVRDVRQVTIQPALRAWLEAFPVDRFPVVPPVDMANHLKVVRAMFGLGHDVLRHTFISAHVAKFRSVGDAAIQAGNSERMVKKHYLNMLTSEESERFWHIAPSLRYGTDGAPVWDEKKPAEARPLAVAA